jgi:hypothetical protein
VYPQREGHQKPAKFVEPTVVGQQLQQEQLHLEESMTARPLITERTPGEECPPAIARMLGKESTP